MAETAEEQRLRTYKKRLAETDAPLIKCLECTLSFVRVGSHVVQVHGYSNTAEYRKAHGLMARETRIPEHAVMMSRKAVTYDNLQSGAPFRFVKGGKHGEANTEFWQNRRLKKE